MSVVPRVIIVLVLSLSLGLHWAALQAVAWTGMLVSFSRAYSLPEAVSMTFDGEHPCALCKFVEAGRAKTTPQPLPQPAPSDLKLDPGLMPQPFEFHFDTARVRIAGDDRYAISRADAPPRPPPRPLS